MKGQGMETSDNFSTTTKRALAAEYFPGARPHTATCHLMSWITRCKPLLRELEASGYQPRQKRLTPRQVRAIVEYLGEP